MKQHRRQESEAKEAVEFNRTSLWTNSSAVVDARVFIVYEKQALFNMNSNR